MSNYKIQHVAGIHDSTTGALIGFLGADGKEYLLPVSPAFSPTPSVDNAPIGTTTPSSGAFTTLSATSALTINGTPALLDSPANTVIILGDSLIARNWRVLTTGLALSVSGTTCTVTLTAHSMYTGMGFRYVDRGESGLMGSYPVASWIDANNFTFPVPAGTPASPTISTSASIMYGARKGDDGFFNHANNLLGQRFVEVNNFGVSGDQTSHVLARMAEVLASPAKKAFVLIGMNDARNGVTLGTYSANLLNIVTQLLNSGKSVDLCTIHPCLAAPNVGTVATCNQLIVSYNRYMKRLARTDPRIMVHDLYAAIVDGTSSTAAVLPGMLAADNIHYAPLGSFTAGNVIATNYQYLPPSVSNGVSSNLDSYVVDSSNTQLLANPLMQGTGGPLNGGATGTAPDNWTVTMASATSLTSSLVARADGIGNDLQMVLVSTSSSSRMRADSESLTARIVAGGTYYVEGYIYVQPGSVIGTMKYELQVVTTSGSVAVLYPGICDVGNGNMTATGKVMRIRSNNFVLPVALSTATVRLDIFASGAGTSTALLGRPSFERVS